MVDPRGEHPIVQNLVVLAYSCLLWPVLARRPLGTVDDFAGLRQLAERWEDVAAEVGGLLEQRTAPPMQVVEPGHRRLSRGPGWRMAVLQIYGQRTKANLGSCPQTDALLAAVPDLTSAMISVMEPGKAIPWHPGIMKGVVRVHLPLQVPDGDAAIQVGRKVHRWVPGQVVLFDDTVPHRAWNRAGAPRVVLLLDLVRPMPWPWLDAINRRMVAWLGRSTRFGNTVARADELARSATTQEPSTEPSSAARRRVEASQLRSTEPR